MRDLVDLMSDRESRMKMGMKILFGDETPDKDEEVRLTDETVVGSLMSQYSLGESEYSLRESHLQNKRYHRTA